MILISESMKTSIPSLSDQVQTTGETNKISLYRQHIKYPMSSVQEFRLKIKFCPTADK